MNIVGYQPDYNWKELQSRNGGAYLCVIQMLRQEDNTPLIWMQDTGFWSLC